MYAALTPEQEQVPSTNFSKAWHDQARMLSDQMRGTMSAANAHSDMIPSIRANIDEFALPYTRKLAGYFGGAWVHYCGRNDALTKAVCAAPAVRSTPILRMHYIII